MEQIATTNINALDVSLILVSAVFAIQIGYLIAYIFGYEPPRYVFPFLHHPFTPPEWLVGFMLLVELPFVGLILGLFWFDEFREGSDSNGYAFLIYAAVIAVIWLVVAGRTFFLIGKSIADNPGGFFRSAMAILLIAAGILAIIYYFDLPIIDFLQNANGRA